MEEALCNHVDFTDKALRRLLIDAQASHQRSEKLRREYERADVTRRAHKSALRKALIRRARAECLQLSALMYLKLPLELRNEVYGHLCIEDRPILIEPYYHFREYVPSGSFTTKMPLGFQLHVDELVTDDEASERDHTSLMPDGRVKYDHTVKPPPDMLLPNSHIFNWRYMGKAVALESQEFYYGRNTFSICNVEDALAEFLDPGMFYQMWAANFVPDPLQPLEPIMFVRNLQIRIKYEHFNSVLCSAMPVCGPEQVYAYECNFLYRLRRSLNILRRLPHQTRKLKIEFVLMTDCCDGAHSFDEHFTNLLEAVRSTIYKLIYSGQDTEITVMHVDEGISPWPRDITGLWNLTKEQWETERVANISSETHCSVYDFYVAPADLSEHSLNGGFPSSALPDLLRQRWGIEDVFKDTKPRWPIQEGRYWPVGNAWR